MTRRKKTLADLAWTASERYRKTWQEEDHPDRDTRDVATGYFDGYLAGRRAEKRARAKADGKEKGR